MQDFLKRQKLNFYFFTSNALSKKNSLQYICPSMSGSVFLSPSLRQPIIDHHSNDCDVYFDHCKSRCVLTAQIPLYLLRRLLWQLRKT